ncbi:amidohydrolase family protein [Phreatobacter oligotrophus]|jgi:5-methylthioadenosine/S-adenosylhomocysteine deaminase|uniref:amidohydrolase family protein n=1 Tax=Phreatobacter oligotrophus TaxID=1122261 RepID=UPI0023558274|nr:amidohydrolase family protein [Phreatobacter oligotrophus]MBX9989974.1 amidohydrolase family protein [Phreatobacter oligotrophus]
MPASLIRSHTLMTGVADRFTCETIDGGAVLQEDGVIAAIGSFAELSARHPTVPVVGTGRELVLPGFVNAHHHVGLTPVQLGSPDMPLELWFITRMVIRNLDLYLDTLYSAFEMVGSGVTTVQHIQSLLPGTATEVEAKIGEVIRAYEAIGMRVSYCYGVRDQNRLVYQADADLIASLPAELQDPMKRYFDRFRMNLDETMGLFGSLHARHQGKRRVKIQLAPANLHWCSDTALGRLAETSERFAAPMHMHLVETAYQKEYAARRGGGTAVDYLDRFGLVNERLTIGHGVWLSEPDIDRLAEAGSCICHNCSSNFRLRSGLAPLNAFEARGLTTAIGIDEAGINDDRDMLQELRMVLRAHRVPGMVEADVPTIPQVLRMATVGGAATTPYGETIGRLEVGKAADLVLHDHQAIAWPYLDAETSAVDALVQRAKPSGVKAVMCDGEILYADGRFTRVDRDAALKALHDDLSKALSHDEMERRHLSKALLPHVRRFYADYIDPARHEPFYRGSSRV